MIVCDRFDNACFRDLLSATVQIGAGLAVFALGEILP